MAIPLLGAAGALLAPVVAGITKYVVGYAIVRVVLALGITVVSYGIVNTVASQIKSYVTSSVGGFGGQFANMAGALGLFEAVNIIFSAYVGAITIRQIMGAYNRITYGGAAS